ncbi:TIGR01906 family membrane protein [Christensenella intestinihominis]|uniref:TIGR01906 family membrane protein n=1 Tax=Christensenella intestinihominis TaxID=1851429 RepID=UPI00083793F7|nr:TIGR01906 family membrane protein [Christensenella intestinihominis]
MSETGLREHGSGWIRLMAAVGTVLVVLSAAVACISGAAFDKSFYREEYRKMDTAAYVGVTDPVLEQATDTLLDYLQGAAPSLDLAMENGEEYYSQREKDHMVDVKALYQNAVLFMTVGFCVGGALIAGCFVWKKKHALAPVLRSYFWATLGVLAFFACIGVWAAADFNNFWVSFHHVFFTNDLWLLDPAVSRMIRMFAETFFAGMVARILAWFLAIAVGTAAAAGIVYQRMKKHGRP